MNENIKKNIIGLRIMQRRKQLRIKQSVLAELIGVSDNQISNIETARASPALTASLKSVRHCSATPTTFLQVPFRKKFSKMLLTL